jgi:hypothetical protein
MSDNVWWVERLAQRPLEFRSEGQSSNQPSRRPRPKQALKALEPNRLNLLLDRSERTDVLVDAVFASTALNQEYADRCSNRLSLEAKWSLSGQRELEAVFANWQAQTPTFIK